MILLIWLSLFANNYLLKLHFGWLKNKYGLLYFGQRQDLLLFCSDTVLDEKKLPQPPYFPWSEDCLHNMSFRSNFQTQTMHVNRRATDVATALDRSPYLYVIQTLIDSARSTLRQSMAFTYDCVPNDSRTRLVSLFCIMEWAASTVTSISMHVVIIELKYKAKWWQKITQCRQIASWKI